MQNSDPYIISHSELQSKDPQNNNCWNGYPKRKQNFNHRFIEPWFACLTKEDKLNGTTLITVHNDPVYHSTKGETFPLLHLLETHTAIKNLDTEKYQIVFECIDGYKPMMPLQIPFGQIISCRQGYGCTKGELWSKIIKTERNELSST
jgi:hypothetical protein